MNSHPNDDGKSYLNKGKADDDNDKGDDENVKEDDDIENQDDYDNENNKVNALRISPQSMVSHSSQIL